MKAAGNLLRSVLHKKRYGLLFNGTDQIVNVPNAAPLDLGSGDVSFELRARMPGSFSGNRGLVYKGSGSFNLSGTGFLVRMNGSVMEFGRGQGSGTTARASFNAVVSTEYHAIARYRESDGRLQLVINGNPQTPAVTTTTGAFADSYDLKIAEGNDGLFNNLIDGLRVYKRYLSDAECLARARGVYEQEVGLLGYWPLDDGAGAVATDLSGYGNHGTLMNAPIWTENYPHPGEERQFLMADLYTFELIGGRTFRYTSADRDITANGFVYSSSGPVLKRSRIREVRGVEVDELTIDIAATPDDKIAGVPWLSAIRSGLLDGARVKLERAFLLDWRYAPAGTLVRFAGRVAPSSAGRTRGSIQVKSDLELLNLMWPRNQFQPGCRNTLYDAGCTLQKWAFASQSAVNGGSTKSSINTSLAQAAGFFDLGAVNFEAALSLPGTSGNYASTPDSAVQHITGDIDLRARIAPDDWTPSSVLDAVIAKRDGNNPADSAYELLLNTSGSLRLQWSTGAAFLSRDSDALGFVDGSTHWVRATMDVDDGAGNRVIKFYHSDDGVAWTQVGGTATIAGTTSIQAHDAPLLVGYDGANATTFFKGKVLYAELRNGIDGPVVAKFDPTNDELPTLLTVKASTGETWTINQSGGTPAALIGTVNRGVTRSVKKHTSGVLQLALPLPNTPVPGDPFFAFPGCDKQLATCETKFNNRPNFRAESFIPLPETAL